MIELVQRLKMPRFTRAWAILAVVIVAVVTAWPSAHTIRPNQIYVIDGDTIDADGQRFRLVGYDTPEIYSPKCAFELELGTAAAERLERLIDSGQLVELKVVAGHDPHDRNLGKLLIDRRDVGDVLISEHLARPYFGGLRAGWCEQQARVEFQ